MVGTVHHHQCEVVLVRRPTWDRLEGLVVVALVVIAEVEAVDMVAAEEVAAMDGIGIEVILVGVLLLAAAQVVQEDGNAMEAEAAVDMAIEEAAMVVLVGTEGIEVDTVVGVPMEDDRLVKIL